MKKSIATLLLLLTLSSVAAQNKNPKYDAQLAEQLGADDYGMKKYIFVILKTGTNNTQDKAFISSCFSGHLKNIQRLVDDKKLVVAGPFSKNEQAYRGLFIFNLSSTEEVRKLLQTDPAIKENLLEAELFEWYGSAAIPVYLEASDKVWKKSPGE
ncbi:hypothetical protein [Flavobacterium sp. CYK-55]|uniref:YciI family protein n=1 Tax=Flavobacterium sp. CYK-55 TaxID=2835529 RepID=UPI00293D5708|nr:hypothetical protein [Flavobacterium sp. CYK-55]